MADFRFHLLVGTDIIMKRLLEAIHLAKHSIKIQFFTFEGDAIGWQVARALIDKSKEGVQVEFLCDDFSNWKVNDRWLFSPHSPKQFLSLLHEWYQTQKMRLLMQFNGIKLRVTEPLNLFKIRASLTSRDHRKLVILDGKTAFTGGYNLSEHNFAWHDTFTEIHDQELVNELERLFDRTFAKQPQPSAPTRVGDSILFHNTPTLMNHLKGLIKQAKKQVFIESPYFVDKNILQLLEFHRKQGIQTAIIIPAKNNTRYVGRIHRRYRKRFPELVRLRVKPTQMLHAKHMVIDNYSVFGSSNFLFSRLIDNHRELTLITKDPSYNKELAEYFTSALKNSCI